MKRLNRTLLLRIIVIFIPIFLTGCGDSKDINDKRVLTAVALDKIDDEIYLYAEITNIENSNMGGEKSEGSSNKYIYVKSHGKTIPEARENLNRQFNKPLFLSAIRTLILTENFAKEYLVEYLYRLRADETYRKKTITVITNEDPEKIFKANNDKNASAGFAIEETLKSLEEVGESFSRTTSRILENLSSKYTGILIPNVGLQENENVLVGYSIINGTTVNGFIPVEDSKALMFLKSNNSKFYYVVPYKNNKYTIDIVIKNKRLKPSYKDKKIKFDIDFEFEAKLMYGDKKTPYKFNESSNKEVTKIITNMLKKELEHAIEQAQKKYKCDYLQFDDEFRIKYPVEFEKMNWGKEFSKLSYNVGVKVELSSTWMMDYETNKRK